MFEEKLKLVSETKKSKKSKVTIVLYSVELENCLHSLIIQMGVDDLKLLEGIMSTMTMVDVKNMT